MGLNWSMQFLTFVHELQGQFLNRSTLVYHPVGRRSDADAAAWAIRRSVKWLQSGAMCSRSSKVLGIRRSPFGTFEKLPDFGTQQVKLTKQPVAKSALHKPKPKQPKCRQNRGSDIIWHECYESLYAT